MVVPLTFNLTSMDVVTYQTPAPPSPSWPDHEGSIDQASTLALHGPQRMR